MWWTWPCVKQIRIEKISFLPTPKVIHCIWLYSYYSWCLLWFIIWQLCILISDWLVMHLSMWIPTLPPGADMGISGTKRKNWSESQGYIHCHLSEIPWVWPKIVIRVWTWSEKPFFATFSPILSFCVNKWVSENVLSSPSFEAWRSESPGSYKVAYLSPTHAWGGFTLTGALCF